MPATGDRGPLVPPPLRLPAPLREYLREEAAGGVALMVAAAIALVWANSPWRDGYTALWETPAALRVGRYALEADLRHWVGDGLMTLFFLVVGLEITREVSTGELRDRRNVAAPALGALGGLAIPAAIYLMFNPTGPEHTGWGVVMSTDTAFVLGVLALFGPRCPDRLRLFLLTLAIVDDIGAISVMAIFYTDDMHMPALLVSAALVAVLLGLRWAGVWRLTPSLLVCMALWLAVHASGVHATLAGVVLGLVLPAKPPEQSVIDRLKVYGRALREQPDAERARLASLAVAATVPAGARLLHALHRWTAYAIVPVFGLANAGVRLDAETLSAAATSSVTIGVAVALVVGNAVGITTGAAIALRTGWGLLPGGVRWSHLMAGATLAGIGFTIALFIADLAFDGNDALKDQATIGILVGSVVAAVLGVILLRVLGERFPLCSPDAPGPPVLPPRPWLDPGLIRDTTVGERA
jgi:Na+:H+ antiporter, NhaA family